MPNFFKFVYQIKSEATGFAKYVSYDHRIVISLVPDIRCDWTQGVLSRLTCFKGTSPSGIRTFLWLAPTFNNNVWEIMFQVLFPSPDHNLGSRGHNTVTRNTAPNSSPIATHFTEKPCPVEVIQLMSNLWTTFPVILGTHTQQLTPCSFSVRIIRHVNSNTVFWL